MRHLVPLLSLSLVPLLAPGAAGQSIFSAYAAGDPDGSVVVDGVATSSGSTGPTDFYGIETGGSAAASRGVVQAYAYARQKASTAGTPKGVTSSASADVLDVVFKSSSSEPFDATLRVNVSVAPGLLWRGIASASVGFAGNQDQGVWNSVASPPGSGMLLGVGEGGGTTTISFFANNLEPNVPYSLDISVSAQSFYYGAGTESHLTCIAGFDVSASDSPPFDLPPGVTVDIPSLNVFDNVWTPPEDLTVDASPAGLVTAGQSIGIHTINGQPGAPAAIFFTQANGVPVFQYTGLFTVFDWPYSWSVSPIATPSSLAGKSFGLTAYSLLAGQALAQSNEVVLNFQ